MKKIILAALVGSGILAAASASGQPTTMDQILASPAERAKADEASRAEMEKIMKSMDTPAARLGQAVNCWYSQGAALADLRPKWGTARLSQRVTDKEFAAWTTLDRQATNDLAELRKLTDANNAGEAQKKCQAVTAAVSRARTNLAEYSGPRPPARWGRMFASIHSLAVEGVETNRITKDEWKQLSDAVAQTRKFIESKKAGGFAEGEEDQIDNLLADLVVRIATYMADEPRKKAASAAAAKAPPATAPAAAKK